MDRFRCMLLYLAAGRGPEREMIRRRRRGAVLLDSVEAGHLFRLPGRSALRALGSAAGAVPGGR